MTYFVHYCYQLVLWSKGDMICDAGHNFHMNH